MRVLVTTEHRFSRTPDGKTWTQIMFSRRHWDLYLAAFEEVRVAARCLPVAAPQEGWLRVDGGPISVVPVPHYIGPAAFLPRAPAVYRTIARALEDVDGAIIKVPSLLGSVVERVQRRRRRPFAVQVVADPIDAFAPGSIRHPLRPFFRLWFARELRRQCRKAALAAYVTEEALQEKYPPGEGVESTHFSDVELPPEAFLEAPRPLDEIEPPLRLVTVASLSQPYKGIDVVLGAVKECLNRGLSTDFTIVGGGQLQADYERMASELGIGDRVHFLGQVTQGGPVRRFLDQADVFVLASMTEGLPRALIEAMARALPCLGSAVGGIPELLAPEDLVPPGDAASLADAIGRVAKSPERRRAMSERNLDRARGFSQAEMRRRAEAFYRGFASLLAAS